MPVSIGSRLGPYEILAAIGAGGMGEVYRARDARLGRDVAIKVLPTLLSGAPDRLRRFEQEARAAAALNHPNILAVFQMGTHEGAPYLVSELLEGATLREQLKRGPIPVRKVIDYGVQVARGLAAAHEKGIVHRDLKPENLFLTKDGRAKILDFGLAKLIQHPEQVDMNAPTVSDLTEPGAVLGTVGYMSPEQVSGQPADHRADIFAFGAILYEMLTGKRAFQKPTSAETMSAILNEDPASLSQSVPMTPSALQRVVHRCLEKNQEQRFQSPSDLAFALEALSDSCSTSAQTPARPTSHRIWPWVAAAVILVLLGVAAGGYFYFHRALVLTEKDSIVVADFTNTTGDPVFDGALRQGLSAHLEQTPFLHLVSPDEIAQTLRLMEKPPDTRLTPDVAREVCQRANATTEIEGSIAALGSQYILGLTAISCSSGETLAQEQLTADGKEKVLTALGNAASKLRSKLGESRTSLEKYDVPLDQMTTSSLEALQAFTRGSVEFNVANFLVAASHLERAVSLDPNFAAAYSVLGTTHAFLGESDLAAQDVKRAYALRDRASEFERLLITATYHLWATGDLERAAQADQVWTQTYARDSRTWINLSYVYRLLGRNDEALAAGLEAVRLDPASAPNYSTPAIVYLRQGRLDQAAEMIREEVRQTGASFPWASYQIDFLRHDQAGMAEHAQQLGPGGSGAESRTAAYRGQLTRARDLLQRAVDSSKRAHASDAVAAWEAESALTETLFGNLEQARSAAMLAIRPPAGWDAQSNGVLALALVGEAVQAERVAADLNIRFPENTFIQFYYVPVIRAALALRRGKPKEAIENLRAAASYEMGVNEVSSVSPAMIPAYVRGQAFLSAHEGAQAAAEFQKILDHPGFVANFCIGALAHVGLARAYVLQGDTAKARGAYQDFLTLWKDADPDIPILKQAKAEYAKLR